MRINISINDKLLEQFDKHCEKLFVDRSGMISQLIRNELFEEQVYPGISKDKREIGLSQGEESVKHPSVESKPSQNAQEGASGAIAVHTVVQKGSGGGDKRRDVSGKVDKIVAIINDRKQKTFPRFCKKHNGQLIGDRYSCGCKV